MVKHSVDLFELTKEFENAGAGEVVINFINKDGLMEGYDIDMAINLKKQINVPLTILGGAGTLEHIAELIRNVGIIGVASGSLFVFKGKYRAVLINYPTREQKLNSVKKPWDFIFLKGKIKFKNKALLFIGGTSTFAMQYFEVF